MMDEGTSDMSIELSPEVYATLEEYASEQGKTVKEFLADAIKLEKFLGDVRRRNQKVLVEENGKLKELRYA